MHIPDGFLSNSVAIVMAVVVMAAAAYSIWKSRRQFNTAKIILGATIAAFIFAIQMLNFPVAEGTSGHFMGAALAAILLGPAGAIVVLTVVLIVQCFIFGDGGFIALGANIFNMAILGGLAAYYTYHGLKNLFSGFSGKLFSAFTSAWLSVVAAAVSCAVLIGVSGTAPIFSVINSMATVHMIIGIGEGFITLVIVAAIYKFRPELFDLTAIESKKIVKPCIIGLGIALALAVFLSPFACPFLDGLEKVAEDHNFLHVGEGKEIFSAPIPDYVFPGINSESAAVSVAGFTGTIITFALFLAISILAFKRDDGKIS